MTRKYRERIPPPDFPEQARCYGCGRLVTEYGVVEFSVMADDGLRIDRAYCATCLPRVTRRWSPAYETKVAAPGAPKLN